MPNTTNFNFPTPADTDLVKDGAAAIRSLGNSIDTAFVDLKGGTTDQVLAKNSNTDLDFKWVAVDPLTILDAKADLITATAADTPARLAVGANGTVLTADSAQSTGLKWASAATAANWSIVNSGGTNLTAAATITVSGITDANLLMVLIEGASSLSASSTFTIRFNADTGTNYPQFGNFTIAASTYAATNFSEVNFFTGNYIEFGKMSANAGSTVSGYVLLSGGNTAGNKAYNFASGSSAATSNTHRHYNGGGMWVNSATITSVSIISDTGNFDAGKIYVYKSA